MLGGGPPWGLEGALLAPLLWVVAAKLVVTALMAMAVRRLRKGITQVCLGTLLMLSIYNFCHCLRILCVP